VRRRRSRAAASYLLRCVDFGLDPTLGIDSPIRGELDIREVAYPYLSEGGQVALPVIVAESTTLEFWSWPPVCRCAEARGTSPFCASAQRDPDAPLIPLVDFDRADY
jgi:5-formyltetrahydrofolate cyclo-ligase